MLDEADEMLDLGFLPDVERIVAMLPTDRQTLLFSATMAGPVLNLARRYMNQPIHIRAHDPEDQGATVKLVKQFAYRAHNLDKVEMLARVLQAEGRGLTLVFCRTKRTAQRVEEELTDRGFAVGSLHGDLGQGARERAMRAFRKGKIDVLVATDVAARGIDVDDITHVVNYQCPDDHSTYVHRIGRTARAGRSGTAITFVDWDELHRWEMIDTALELGIGQARETYSASPWLYSDLGIPAGAKGVLPRDKRVREGLEGEEVEDLGETGKHTPKSAPPKRHHESRGGRGGGHAAGEGGGTRAARAPRERTRTRTRGGEEAASRPAEASQPAEPATRRTGCRGRRRADQAPAPTRRARTRFRQWRRGSGQHDDRRAHGRPAVEELRVLGGLPHAAAHPERQAHLRLVADRHAILHRDVVEADPQLLAVREADHPVEGEAVLRAHRLLGLRVDGVGAGLRQTAPPDDRVLAGDGPVGLDEPHVHRRLAVDDPPPLP